MNTPVIAFKKREKGGYYATAHLADGLEITVIVRETETYHRTTEHFRWEATRPGMKNNAGWGSTRIEAVRDILNLA